MTNSVDDEEVTRKWEARMSHWENVCRKQFQLVYFGKFNYEDTENMSLHELEFFYGQLVAQKTLEKESYEKAIDQAKRGGKPR